MFIIPIYLFSEIFPGVSRGPICSSCTRAHSPVWPPLLCAPWRRWGLASLGLLIYPLFAEIIDLTPNAREQKELTWSLRPNGWYGLTPGGSSISQTVAPTTWTDINNSVITTSTQYHSVPCRTVQVSNWTVPTHYFTECKHKIVLHIWPVSTDLSYAFSALTLLVGRQEEHPVCNNWVMRCWCGYLYGARCRLFALSSSWCHCIPKPRHLLPHLNPDWFYLSGIGLLRLSRKRGR